MEACESLEPEMTELQELQSEASEAVSQDDEDELEELQNSLREVVQDQSVKPKLQCLMVDPSFSMVTVQSEDSGIVWETASSRCSTPWASETSSISEGYSMDGSGAAGKITIVFDEEKIVRRRIRSGGRSSRLGDRLSRPGSSRSTSALGVERPEMMEVSLPNVKEEKTETEPDLEEIKNKDQQLFSLISEGYEILNIRVPSKLPTVDEEESTELHDNLSYLDQTPQIRSRNPHDWTPNHVLPEEGEVLGYQEDSSQPSADTKAGNTPTQKESTSDFDYFENFTLLDHAVPAEQVPELQQEKQQPPVKPKAEEQTPAKETATDSPSASEDSFVFVTDVDMVGEHLDEVFYGEGSPADAPQRKDDDEADGGVRMRMRRESQRMMKEGGSVLFGSEETTLTPIYISAGPPKIIDQILLEEPTAMSFMYSDLYEDAVGQRLRSDEEYSEAESVTSEKSYKRRFSDSDEAEGYLEKFILKDETSTVEAQPESVKDMRVGRMMFSQTKFEMTGCLTRTVEEAEIDKTKTEEPKIKEVRAGDRRDDVQSATFEEEVEVEELSMLTGELEEESVQGFKLKEVKEMKHEREEHKESIQIEQSLTETKQPYQTQEEVEKMPEGLVKDKDETATEESIHGFKLTEVKEMKHEVKRDQAEPQTSSTDEPLPDIQEVGKEVEQKERESEELQREEHKQSEQSLTETKQPCQTQEEVEKMPEELVKDKDETAPEESIQEFKLTEVKEIKQEVKKDQAEPQISSTDEPLPDIQEVEKEVEQKERESEELQRKEHKQSEQSLTETKQPYQTQEEVEKMPEGLVKAKDETAPESNEVPQRDVQSEIQTETSEENLSEEAAADTKMEAADEKTTTEAKPEVVVEEEIITSTETSGEPKTSVETSLCEETEDFPEDVGPVEVITDCDSAVQAVVEVTEKAVNEKEIQTQVTIDLQEAAHDEEAAADTKMEAADEKTTTETKPEIVVEEEIITSTETSGELKTSVDKSQCEETEDIPEDVGPVEVITDCDSAVQAVVEVTEKAENEKEIQTQVQIDLQEAAHDDTADFPTARLEAAAKSQSPEFVAEAHQESEVRTEISSEVAKPVILEEVEADSNEKHGEIDEALQQQPEESMTEVKAKTPTDDTGTVVQDMVSVGDELILLVPKGQAVEMDIEISQWSDKTPSDAQAVPEPDSVYEHLVASEDTPMPIKETKTENQLELEPEVHEKVEEPLEYDLDRACSPPAPEEEVDTEEKKTEEEVDEDEGVFSPLRTFTPLEDLSGLQGEDIPPEEPDVELKAEVNEAADGPEAISIIQDVAPDVDLQREDTEKKMEQDEVVEEAPEAPVEELEYEVISKQDAEEMPESETQRDAEESSAESEDECESGKHQSHEVMSVDKAYDQNKEKLSDWISELQGQSENIEDLVSELELAYNSVEDQCVDGEVAMQAQNEEMMALVMEQYNNMSVSMEEEKKAKLEQLYDQIVSFQESIDTTKVTLETTAREAETDARVKVKRCGRVFRLDAALDSAMSLELGPKGLLVFEDYAKGNTSSSHVEHRKGIPVPQRPTLQPQEPGSATSTSVTVYWKVNPGDIIDCFQVYCMEDPHGAVSEEYRVTVKESYCVLEELEPDKTYKVWVMAVNYTGCSLPSDRLAFTTAPSVPVIDTERCTIMWDSATLRWQKQTPGQSYTLEYCRQYDLEGEGLRSISGIRICEQRVLLQPNENYLFYIKAVNETGASEQSEAALISTKGTRFHLLKASAHPALELSEDQTALHFSQDARENIDFLSRCPSVLGELLSARGRYYWETIVSGSTAYRLGVAYSAANRDSSLGENSQSWCLQCVPTPSGCRYQLLYNQVQSSVFVIEMPERVGTLLDYQLGRLSFYNPLSGQLLGTFSQRFTQPCHPALALEMPGSLEVRMVLEVPEFTKES
ncbi:cardiomyopathy-associated protein 5 [Limanda limanda]|uniref:cardiomyopathy-associated protein 5 n=1 Tax=Limanda limanda TaxID=27771 RepID=UPI0029C67426|nr:cardiomyopathy-associated protein 5 [Limanda limanda]